jgi:hypothetical protein
MNGSIFNNDCSIGEGSASSLVFPAAVRRNQTRWYEHWAGACPILMNMPSDTESSGSLFSNSSGSDDLSFSQENAEFISLQQSSDIFAGLPYILRSSQYIEEFRPITRNASQSPNYHRYYNGRRYHIPIRIAYVKCPSCVKPRTSYIRSWPPNPIQAISPRTLSIASRSLRCVKAHHFMLEPEMQAIASQVKTLRTEVMNGRDYFPPHIKTYRDLRHRELFTEKIAKAAKNIL